MRTFMKRTFRIGRLLALVGTVLLVGLPQRVMAENESQVCNPDGQVVVYGNVLASCTIEVVADLDIFTFQGSVGEDVTIVLTRTGGSSFSQPCLELRDPDGTTIANPCGNSRINTGPLSEPGTYQLLVSAQNNNGTVTFNLSLERLFPLRSPTPVGPGDNLVGGEINPIADLDTFSFNANAGDQFRLILTRTGGSSFSQLCVELRGPDNSDFVVITCGNANLTLPAAPMTGTYQVIVTAQNNNGTVVFNLSLTCLSGGCPARPPTCVVDPSLVGSTLRLDFTVGTPQPAQLYVGLAALGNEYPFFATIPVPVIDPPVSGPVDFANFPKLGKVGVLFTLTTGTGLTCSDFKTVDTGLP